MNCVDLNSFCHVCLSLQLYGVFIWREQEYRAEPNLPLRKRYFNPVTYRQFLDMLKTEETRDQIWFGVKAATEYDNTEPVVSCKVPQTPKSIIA